MAEKNKKKDEAVEMVVTRNDFYRDGYGAQRKILFVLVLTLSVSALFNFVLFSMKPEVRVIAVDNAGRVVPVISLKEPMVSASVLNSWVVERTVDLYTYDFRGWQKDFQAISSDFTGRGWKEFSKAMKKSNNMKVVQQDQVFVSSVPQGAAVIVKEGDFNGVYAWKVEFPMLVTYEGASETTTQNLMMTVVVVRADLITHPTGLAIEQVISRDM